jgi:hypothetical protein
MALSITQEHTGIVLLSFFIFALGASIDLLGILFWLRKIRPNKIIGINIKSMGDNQGDSQHFD